jgi:hypothetical protein
MPDALEQHANGGTDVQDLWLPDFTAQRYHDTLVELDAELRAEASFDARSTRHRIEARG